MSILGFSDSVKLFLDLRGGRIESATCVFTTKS